MNHTQNVFITWQKKHEFWRELLPKSRNSFNITDSKAILQRCENEEIGEVLAPKMRSESDFVTSVCCGGECDLKGC